MKSSHQIFFYHRFVLKSTHLPLLFYLVQKVERFSERKETKVYNYLALKDIDILKTRCYLQIISNKRYISYTNITWLGFCF